MMKASAASGNAVLAKARALYGRRLRADDYRRLMGCRTMTELDGHIAVGGLDGTQHIGGGQAVDGSHAVCGRTLGQNGDIGGQGLGLGVFFNDRCGDVVQHGQQGAADQADDDQHDDGQHKLLEGALLLGILLFSHYSAPPFLAFLGFL